MADFYDDDRGDQGARRDAGHSPPRAHPYAPAAPGAAHHPVHRYTAPNAARPNSATAARPAPGRPGFFAIIGWGGTAVSVGLVVGMVWWAAHLALRDLSGVPVIRALEGPMRVAPTEPGGTQADHQGLAVNRIAEGAEAAPVPDRLVLAPAPVDLDPATLDAAFPPDPVEAGAEGETEAAVTPTPEAINAGTHELIERLMARSDGESEGASGADAVTAITASASAPASVAPSPAPGAVQVISASVSGVSRSMRPPVRPIPVMASTGGSAQPPSAMPVEDVDPATLTAGTRLVQLGAFDTPEIARTEWDRLIARFPDYFQDRARVIEQANSGGAPFYRLRALGFDDLAQARRFCTVLMAASAPCVPVTVR